MPERTYLFGYGSGPWGSATRKTKAEILANSHFDHVHPEEMRRVFGLADYCIDRGHDFGFGGGDREFPEQDAEFRRRHFIAPTGIWYYDGHWWQRWYWAAPYAPPGHSWHEAGASTMGALAVDALGDHVFATPICHLFGLVNGISSELWHYQPLEIPHARGLNQVWGALAIWPLPADQEDDMRFEFYQQGGKHHYDSRVPEPGSKLEANKPRPIPVPRCADGTIAIGAMITVTGTQSEGGGFMSVFPNTNDGSSCLNYDPGETIANTTSVQLAADGTFKVQSKVASHVVIDVVGLYHA